MTVKRTSRCPQRPRRSIDDEIAAKVAARTKCRNAIGLIRLSAIRRLADQIAERFDPEKIILFGSYAYGKPDPESDVDVLVVMPAYNVTNQAIRIRRATTHPFPLDLIVRTPNDLHWRLREGDWFLREIVNEGRVLYEKTRRSVGTQGRKGLGGGSQFNKEQAAAK
jgi:predicted nucleotidyltransferase